MSSFILCNDTTRNRKRLYTLIFVFLIFASFCYKTFLEQERRTNKKKKKNKARGPLNVMDWHVRWSASNLMFIWIAFTAWREDYTRATSFFLYFHSFKYEMYSFTVWFVIIFIFYAHFSHLCVSVSYLVWIRRATTGTFK